MYNGVCQSSANCPNGGHPNASNGNLCECPGYFGGPTCSGEWGGERDDICICYLFRLSIEILPKYNFALG